MTHSSIMPLEFEGERMYVYCANKGAVDDSAKDGRLLWETEEWKISIATVPSPVILNNGRIFFSGGYNAGSLLLELKKDGGNITPRSVMRLAPGVFGATQQTPILYGDHLYGVRADGKFVCLDLEGKIKRTSASGQPFGLGPFLITDGFIYSVHDSGLLLVISSISLPRPDRSRDRRNRVFFGTRGAEFAPPDVLSTFCQP